MRIFAVSTIYCLTEVLASSLPLTVSLYSFFKKISSAVRISGVPKTPCKKPGKAELSRDVFGRNTPFNRVVLSCTHTR